MLLRCAVTLSLLAELSRGCGRIGGGGVDVEAQGPTKEEIRMLEEGLQTGRIGDIQIPSDAEFELSGSDERCLHGSTPVLTPSGPVPAKELAVGQALVGFRHFRRSNDTLLSMEASDGAALRAFVRVELSSGRHLLVTPEHGLYSSRCGQGEDFALGPASDLTPDACLPRLAGDGLLPEKVASLALVREQGVFRPVSKSGNLVIHDVLVSCFDAKDARAQRSLGMRRTETTFDRLGSWLVSML